MGDDMGATCHCGYERPKFFIIQYGQEWTFDSEVSHFFQKNSAFRLMGKYVGSLQLLFENLKHVTHLYLSRTSKFSVFMLSDCNSLIDLELDYAPITNLSGIENITTLQSLALTECRKLERIEFISQVNNLRQLRIALCNKIIDYSPIADLAHLSLLTIEANQVKSIKFIENLKDLRILALPITKISDIGLPDFSKISSLLRVYLPSKRWADPVEIEIRNHHPNCIINR